MIHKLKSMLLAQPPAPLIQDKGTIDKTYSSYRLKTMIFMMTGYAAFYMVRKNFSMAMPTLMSELNYTKTDLGIILSLFSIIYGVGKFVNGMLADRSNARYFMAIGLLGSALMNIFFGLSSGVIFLTIFWLINAWFQSMGWPPCARLLTHWYSPRELGTKWGIWNASHQIGGAGILILSGYLIANYGWRSAFIVPSFIAIGSAILLMIFLRDTPESLGLPSIEVYHGDVEENLNEQSAIKDDFWDIMKNHIINNKMIWYLCIANFFVYIVRIGVLDWAPTFLVEAKGSSLEGAGYKTAAFEIAGIGGAIFAGWISDKIFKGRRGPVNVIFMLALIFFLVYLWKVPAGNQWMDAAALIAIGVLVYGPQMLVGVSAADFASKKAVATATGLTGTFGYLGSAACGVGTGVIVDKWGWDGGFTFFVASAIIGTFFFMLTWNGKASTNYS